MATLGLLPGTTSVYEPQLAPAGAPAGQLLFEEMEMRPVESTSGLVLVAGIVSSGMVSWRVALVPEATVWRAASVTSTDAPPSEEVFAVTTPCKIAGDVAPVSAT